MWRGPELLRREDVFFTSLNPWTYAKLLLWYFYGREILFRSHTVFGVLTQIIGNGAHSKDCWSHSGAILLPLAATGRRENVLKQALWLLESWFILWLYIVLFNIYILYFRRLLPAMDASKCGSLHFRVQRPCSYLVKPCYNVWEENYLWGVFWRHTRSFQKLAACAALLH